MNKIITFSLIVFLLFASFGQAEITKESNSLTLNNKHQFGGRLGVWINGGETPPAIIYNPLDSADRVVTSIKDANFYIEGFFAYNIFPSAFIEISLGIANRGSVTVFENFGTDTTIDIGNLILYPMLIQFKYYPIASLKSKFQPYFGFGGGLYYGRRDIQLTNNYYTQYYGNFGESESDFNYTLSGGFDWLLNNSLGLDFSIKYMPVNFSNPLVSIKDYKATTVTVGIKYMR